MAPIGYWIDVKNQRKFFEKLALDQKITTLDEWYSLTVFDIQVPTTLSEKSRKFR